jgi:hypothetical protein
MARFMQLVRKKKCEAGGHLHITETSPATLVRFKLKYNPVIYCVLLKHLFINDTPFMKLWIIN